MNKPVQLDVFDENDISLMGLRLQELLHTPPLPTVLTDEEVRALIDAVYDDD